jgi:hypothetical protein
VDAGRERVVLCVQTVGKNLNRDKRNRKCDFSKPERRTVTVMMLAMSDVVEELSWWELRLLRHEWHQPFCS